MTADLSAIIARLEAAEVGGDELSARAMQVLVVPNGRVEQSRINGAWCIYVGDQLWQERGWWRPDGWPVTTSLDAALALAERVLPGWLWDVTTITTAVGGLRKPLASVVRPDQTEGEEIKTWGYGATPALALCIAILRAKQGEG